MSGLPSRYGRPEGHTVEQHAGVCRKKTARPSCVESAQNGSAPRVVKSVPERGPFTREPVHTAATFAPPATREAGCTAGAEAGVGPGDYKNAGCGWEGEKNLKPQMNTDKHG